MEKGRCIVIEGIRGFFGGALIAFICFAYMMPLFFEGAFYTALLGMVAGIFTAVFTEAKVYQFFGKFHKNSRIANLFFVCAAESILFGCNSGGLRYIQAFIGCILFFHTAIFLFFIYKGKEKYRLSVAASAAFVLAILFLWGKSIGHSILLLAAAVGGYLLYMGCGEIFPEVEKTNYLFSSKGCALLGFLTGILILCKFS